MRTSQLIYEPVWPWSLLGLPGLACALGFVLLLTLWTYRNSGLTRSRLLTLLLLRLLAVLLSFLVSLRPSWATREHSRTPAVLLIVVDASRSMSTEDEFDQLSRWEYLLRCLRECEPTLQRLRAEQNVDVQFVRFAQDVGDFELGNPGLPDGLRTDVGKMLDKLYTRVQGAGRLRGLILLSDGADNGVTTPAIPLASRWRNLPCPIHTVGFGKVSTDEKHRDLAFVNLVTKPTEVPIKNEFIVEGTLDAAGYVGSKVRVQLFFDDKPEPIDTAELFLPQALGNPVRLKGLAPEKPGELKVTLRVQPLAGELTRENNEISTYVQVTKEGVSVLLVERGDRFPEPQMLATALASDRRFRRVTKYLNAQPSVTKDYFELDSQAYDVILLGDVTAQDLLGRDPQVFEKLTQRLTAGGAGLGLVGSDQCFVRGGWQNTPLDRFLPTALPGKGPSEAEVRLLPLPEFLNHPLLRLDEVTKNLARWQSLPELDGYQDVGTPKASAQVLARAEPGKVPLLVAQELGRGRAIAVGADTTHYWRKDAQGSEAHRRFWTQTLLWLSHQDQAEGSVWVEPERRRLTTGEPIKFLAGLKGKQGDRLEGGQLQAQLVTPTGVKRSVDLTAQGRVQQGVTFQTEEAGEYRLEVTGTGTEPDGTPIPADPSKASPVQVRFLVRADTLEMTRKSANHDFLQNLKEAGGGEFLLGKDLGRLLLDLEKQQANLAGQRLSLWPDWRSPTLSPLLLLVLLCFVALLSSEWFLRRRWGLV